MEGVGGGVFFSCMVLRVTIWLFAGLADSDCKASNLYNFHLRRFTPPPPAEDKTVIIV
jgi:hypothetical protein